MKINKNDLQSAITILESANETTVLGVLYELMKATNLQEVDVVDINQYVFLNGITIQDVAMEIESLEEYPGPAKQEHINGVIDYLSENYLPEDITESNKDTILEEAVNSYFEEEYAKAKEAEEEYRQNMGPFHIY